MSKDIKKTIMEKIENKEIKMKPKWFFILGSFFLFLGTSFTFVFLVFLFNLISFSLRSHGPMGEIRYAQLISSFPYWILPLAFAGLISGIFLLKKYEFSYKKNFAFLCFSFVLITIFSGFLIDYVGLNSQLKRRGEMRRFYEQFEKNDFRKGGKVERGFNRNFR